MACEEHEVASLTTLHLDSETSSLSHTVTVTGNAHNIKIAPATILTDLNRAIFACMQTINLNITYDTT